MHDSDGVLLLLLSLFISYFVIYWAIILGAIHYIDKLMFGLPWLKWLTLEEAKNIAPSFFCRLLLPIFHKKGHLEIRERDDIDVRDQPLTEKGFESDTVHLFEFRLIKRKNRRRKVSEKPKDAWKPIGELPV